MSKATNERNRNRNTKIIVDFCHEFDFEFKELNNGFQYRIEGLVDFYPVRGRWHNIRTGERGEWHDDKDLRRILLEAIPVRQLEGKTPEQILGVVDEVAFIDASELEKIELPAEEPGKIEYYSNAPDDEQFIFPRGDGFKTIGTQPQEFNILSEPEEPKVETVQLNNKLFILNGRDPLRYVDLTTNKVHQYPGEYRVDMWYKKPRWWQWRLKRKYRKVLTTNND